MAYTSDEDRWAIIAAWRKHRNISTVARVLGKSRGVVRRWIRRYEETGNVKHGKSTGRKPALAGDAAEKALELMVSQHSPGSEGVAQQLKAMGITSKKLHKSTIIRTARKVAKSQGAPIYPDRGKPSKRLTAATKKKRVAFAKANKSRSWANVMFTDRKRFYFSYPGVKVHPVVWLRKGSKAQAFAVSHPQSFNVYAGLCKYGMTACHPVAGTSKQKSPYKNKDGQQAKNITMDEYPNVLKSTLLPEATRIFTTQGIGSWVFQQDNDPAHSVAIPTVAEWNRSHASSIEVLSNWPPSSPDLSPIENVWGYVQAKVNALGCKTFQEFKQAVMDGIKTVPKSMINNLFNSMPKRVAKVIEGDGEKTGY